MRSVDEHRLVPAPLAEHAEVLEELAHEYGVWTRDRHVVGRPRKRGNLVLAPPSVPAHLVLELEEDEVAIPLLFQAPRGRKAGDAGADDYDGHAYPSRRRRHGRPVANGVSNGAPVVDEAAAHEPVGLSRAAHQRGRRPDQEAPTADAHRSIRLHSSS